MISQNYNRKSHILVNSYIRKHSIQTTDDEHSNQKQNCAHTQQSKKKYKTQMCKNFQQTGHCRYGNKCRFAHGYQELSCENEMKNQSYRTKKCFSFWNNGICPYGSRCQFRHYELTNQTKNFLKICDWVQNKHQDSEQKSRLKKILFEN